MAERITLNAPDISCSHCVATVQKAVGALPGVESVQASETTKNIDVAYDPARVTLEQIASVLDEEGYPATAA
jgi:copper ion binding protein